MIAIKRGESHWIAAVAHHPTGPGAAHRMWQKTIRWVYDMLPGVPEAVATTNEITEHAITPKKTP